MFVLIKLIKILYQKKCVNNTIGHVITHKINTLTVFGRANNSNIPFWSAITCNNIVVCMCYKHNSYALTYAVSWLKYKYDSASNMIYSDVNKLNKTFVDPKIKKKINLQLKYMRFID